MNFRKAFSVAAAAAVAVSVASVQASAAAVAFSLPVTLNSQDDSKMIQWELSNFYKDDSSVIKTVKMSGTAPFSSAGWTGGGGAVGFNADDGWAQVDFGTDDMKIDGDKWSIELTFDVKKIDYVNGDKGDPSIVQIGWWWGAGDTLTIESFEVTYTSGTVVGAESGAEEEAAEETTLPADTEADEGEPVAISDDIPVEEAVEEEAEEEEAEEEDWEDDEDWDDDEDAGSADLSDIMAELEAAGAIKVSGEGSTTGAWGQSNVMRTYLHIDEGDTPGDDAFDISLLNPDNVIVAVYESDVAPELILQSWSGGAGWAKVPANEELSKDNYAVFTYDYMTAMYETDDFSSLDAVNIGDQGAPLTVAAVYVVSASGNAAPEAAEVPAAETPAAEETPAPAAAAETSSSVPATGNLPAGAMISVMAAAAAAAAALRKRK